MTCSQVREFFVSSSRIFRVKFAQTLHEKRAGQKTCERKGVFCTNKRRKTCEQKGDFLYEKVKKSRRRCRHNNKLIKLIFQTLTFVDVDVVGDALDYVLQLGQRLCCRLDFFFSFVVHLAAAAAAADAAVANDGQSAMQASFKEDDACLRPTSQQPGG